MLTDLQQWHFFRATSSNNSAAASSSTAARASSAAAPYTVLCYKPLYATLDTKLEYESGKLMQGPGFVRVLGVLAYAIFPDGVPFLQDEVQLQKAMQAAQEEISKASDEWIRQEPLPAELAKTKAKRDA